MLETWTTLFFLLKKSVNKVLKSNHDDLGLKPRSPLHSWSWADILCKDSWDN